MIKRRRFKQTASLADRLTENVEQLRAQLAKLPPGLERDSLVRRIRQSEAASHIEDWLRFPRIAASCSHVQPDRQVIRQLMAQFSHFLTFVSRKGFIALNVKSEAEAVKVARMIAEETCCAVGIIN